MVLNTILNFCIVVCILWLSVGLGHRPEVQHSPNLIVTCETSLQATPIKAIIH